MKVSYLFIAALACSFSAFGAATPSQSVEQFCSDRSSAAFSKELTKSSENLMAFQNRGGIANGGVCWWHSRFQRNALYLTVFKPTEARPSKEEAEKIIADIRSAKEIVEIPGFRNFNEFSNTHRSEIQRELEKWQKGDGVIRFNWVIGLRGDNVISAEQMKRDMDELYQYVEGDGNIAYQKLQIKGVTAHAWLVVNMRAINDSSGKGYDLEVLDSNYANRTNAYNFREGQTHFSHAYYGEFTPYLERKGEMEKINLTILKKCNPDEYKIRKAKQKVENSDNNA
ncbi:MAG: hypothetical protein WC635_16315 [Bacteriovorax sp.]|jgi:hypothetical protein